MKCNDELVDQVRNMEDILKGKGYYGKFSSLFTKSNIEFVGSFFQSIMAGVPFIRSEEYCIVGNLKSYSYALHQTPFIELKISKEGGAKMERIFLISSNCQAKSFVVKDLISIPSRDVFLSQHGMKNKVLPGNGKHPKIRL